MRMRFLLAASALAALAACSPKAAVPRPATAAKPLLPPGLDMVIGKTASALEALFGPPDQDLREPKARRLQFAGPACVLDAYLYPRPGAAEPIVTYVDARLPNGDDFDRASCVAALSRRKQAQ